MMIRNSVFQRFIEKIHTDILGKAFCKLRYLQISKNNWEHVKILIDCNWEHVKIRNIYGIT